MKRSTALLVALSTVFLLVLIRTAWVADDAYITFRTVYNAVHGYGLRWNVDERVQTYTHPLWMLLMTLGYRVTGEPYYTSIALSIALSLGAVVVVQTRVATGNATALLGMACLTLSRAFVDYSTSGLENALTHFLMAMFWAVYFADSAERRLFRLVLLVSLVMVNRLDAGLVLVPALALALWTDRSRPATWGSASAGRTMWGSASAGPVTRAWLAAAWGLCPLVLWEVFSVVYYGFPFPNTAYAKLQTGVPAAEAVKQGLLYLANSLNHDPLTLVAIVVVAVLAAWTGRARERAAMAGAMLYLAYTVWIGGDFMSGRLLAAPLLCAVVVMMRLPIVEGTGELSLGAATAFAGLLAFTAPHPTLLSNAYEEQAPIEFSGISDERLYYYKDTGLLRMPPEGVWIAAPETNLRSAAEHEGKHTVTWAFVGMTGYDAGPSIHVIDPIALGDPLLARLPARTDWRVGHYRRDVPEGYEETVETGVNRIKDPAVSALYERLRIITSGPVWRWARFRAIFEMNTGRARGRG